MTKYYLLNDTYVAAKTGDVIKVGNPMAIAMPCVVLEVQDDTFYLASVSHHPSCNIEQNMQHGRLGTIQMMRLAFIFAKAMYPSIRHVEFMDTSGYHDVEAGFNVTLSDKEFFFTGKTWYEQVLEEFNLRPKFQQDQHHLEHIDHVMRSFPSIEDARRLSARHFTISKRKNIRENLMQLKSTYGSRAIECMYIFQRQYRLATLHGISWIGSMDSPNPFGVPFHYTPMKHPKASELKAKWGGQVDHEPIRNNVM